MSARDTDARRLAELVKKRDNGYGHLSIDEWSEADALAARILAEPEVKPIGDVALRDIASDAAMKYLPLAADEKSDDRRTSRRASTEGNAMRWTFRCGYIEGYRAVPVYREPPPLAPSVPLDRETLGKIARQGYVATLAKEVQEQWPWESLNEPAKEMYRLSAEAVANAVLAARPPAPSGPTFSQRNKTRCESPTGFNHRLDSWTLSDWMTATAGELGEAANLIKKLNRVRDGIPGNTETPEQLRAMLADELADIACYLDLLAQAAGFDLEAIRDEKFTKVSRKIGYDDHARPAAPSVPEAEPLPPAPAQPVERIERWGVLAGGDYVDSLHESESKANAEGAEWNSPAGRVVHLCELRPGEEIVNKQQIAAECDARIVERLDKVTAIDRQRIAELEFLLEKCQSPDFLNPKVVVLREELAAARERIAELEKNREWQAKNWEYDNQRSAKQIDEQRDRIAALEAECDEEIRICSQAIEMAEEKGGRLAEQRHRKESAEKARDLALQQRDEAVASYAAVADALGLATDDQSREWRAWIHEEDCPGAHEAEECRCDGSHIVETVAAVLATDCGKAFSERLAAAEKARDEALAEVKQIRGIQFEPSGDNHHNAALCPYCGEPLRQALAEIERLKADCEAWSRHAAALNGEIDRLKAELARKP